MNELDQNYIQMCVYNLYTLQRKIKQAELTKAEKKWKHAW